MSGEQEIQVFSENFGQVRYYSNSAFIIVIILVFFFPLIVLAFFGKFCFGVEVRTLFSLLLMLAFPDVKYLITWS